MNRKYHLLSILLLASSLLPVQADKFGLWTDFTGTQKLWNTGITANFNVGLRLNNNLNNVDRWNAGIGFSYDIFKWLEAGVGYSYMYNYKGGAYDLDRNEHYNSAGNWNGYNLNTRYEHSYWRSKNRFHTSLQGKLDIGRFTISLRERYQLTSYNSTSTPRDIIQKEKYRYNTIINTDGTTSYELQSGYPETETFDQSVADQYLSNNDEASYQEYMAEWFRTNYKDHKTKHYMRSRVQIEYNIPKFPLNPYVGFEVSNNLSNGFSIDKRRYSCGVDWTIVKKKQYLSIGYIYNNGNDDDEDGNLHALEISYKIKGIFTKGSSKK